ncbi:hypothetical protein BHM03_00051867 [Ensete ventricosum]|nr:hypothetical protein BHM03_00051867 [Ensete ventricosum]
MDNIDIPKRESPYSLAFGTEVVLLPKVVFLTLKVKRFTPEASKASLRENLDLAKELRAKAHLRTLHSQKAIAQLYNRKGKLAPRWEGPYRVVRTIREGTYTIATMDDTTLPRT